MKLDADMKSLYYQGRLPKVILDNPETQIKIGKWLRVKGFKDECSFLDQITKTLLLAVTRPYIENRFAHILKKMGIPEDETCVIFDNPREEALTVTFASSQTEGRITFKKSDGHNWSDEITLEYLNTFKTYEYYPLDGALIPKYFAFTNPFTKNSYIRYFSRENFKMTLNNNGQFFEICLSPLEENNSGYPFVLLNESELSTYLLNIQFPLMMDEVYGEICRITGFNPEDYRSAVFTTYKKDDLTDSNLILINDGLLRRFTITKDGWKVDIDQDGHTTIQPASQYGSNTQADIAIDRVLNFRKKFEVSSK